MIIIQGEDVNRNALVRIGQLSEQDQEARIKDFRRLRERDKKMKFNELWWKLPTQKKNNFTVIMTI